jgi:hypothetical protein
VPELWRTPARQARLLEEGDRSDPATLLRLLEASAWLAAAVPYLLDEIERLRADRPEPSPAFLKMDSQMGSA